MGLGITMVVDVLKYDGQWPSLMHTLAMLIMLFKHDLSLIICLRYFHKSLSGLGTEVLLHLAMELIDSFLENALQDENEKDRTKTSSLMF